MKTLLTKYVALVIPLASSQNLEVGACPFLPLSLLMAAAAPASADGCATSADGANPTAVDVLSSASATIVSTRGHTTAALARWAPYGMEVPEDVLATPPSWYIWSRRARINWRWPRTLSPPARRRG